MATISKPYTFTAGSTIIASEHNDNFDTVYNAINGGLQNVNIASDAAIGDTKLAQITTAAKVSGTAITGLNDIPDSDGTLDETNGGTGQSTITQGDLLYGSAANVLSKLAKDANATRYLANTGTSNNPAWNQVNLANGVTGTLTHENGGVEADISSVVAGDIIVGTGTGTMGLKQGAFLLSKTTLSATTNSGDITIGTSKFYRVLISLFGTNSATLSIRFNSDSTATRYSWFRETRTHEITPTITATGDDSDDAIDLGIFGSANNIFSLSFDMETQSNRVFLYGNGLYDYTIPTKMLDFSGTYNQAPTDFELVSSGNMSGTIYVFEVAR